CCGAFCISSLLLLGFTLRGLGSVSPIYFALLLNGIVRAFQFPAGQAFLPQLVPRKDFPNAVAWGSSIFQTATIVGPVIGGLLYSGTGSAVPVYLSSAMSYAFGMLLIAYTRVQTSEPPRSSTSSDMLLGGLRYIWRNKLIL